MKLLTYRLLLASVLLSFLVAGCANQPRKLTNPVISQDWPQHETRVQAISQWQALGKLGVKVPNDGGSANLNWQQHDQHFQIDLNGPLGQGRMSIAGAPGQVTFSEGGNAPQNAKTAEELITKNTGWTIPVTQLAWWVRGLPEPQTKITRFETNNLGLIGELEQMGWKLTYGDYLNVQNAQGEPIPMPGRIVAEFKDIKLTLVIREWKLETVQ